MKRRKHMSVLPILVGATLFITTAASSADKVVVVPLGGTMGNATATDVVQGKTFSSKAAGKGAVGTLKVRAGGTLYTNSIGMEFSLIPSGSFVMGSPDGTGDTTHRPVNSAEGGRSSIERQHYVNLTKSFYMQTTEVTRGQWKAVMGSANDPSTDLSCPTDDCPVQTVSWDEAQNFIGALNVSEGRTNCNTTPNTCYTLPTESQWEYAARAGTTSAFYNGDITNILCSPIDPNLDKIGWYCGNSGSTTHPVALKDPNSFGLYDMSGNVWEWCQDWYGTYPDGPETDPVGAVSGTQRMNRGAGWGNWGWSARSANRAGATPDVRNPYQGFRLVLSSGQ